MSGIDGDSLRSWAYLAAAFGFAFVAMAFATIWSYLSGEVNAAIDMALTGTIVGMAGYALSTVLAVFYFAAATYKALAPRVKSGFSGEKA